MGKMLELFSQKEMRRFKVRFEQSREELLKERLNIDDGGLEGLLAKWEREREEKREERKIRRKEEKSRQLELFPEQKERALWRKSVKEMSTSKLATYRGCPLAFYYHYIMHVKVPQSPNKIFGKEIHYMLESFHKKNFSSADSFIKFWLHRWWGVVNGVYGDVNIAFKTKEQPGQFCGIGKRILKPFYEHNRNLPKPHMYEKDFREYNISFDGIRLIGKWDRVDNIEGKALITDYKTDRMSPKGNMFLLHRHPQFTFYAFTWYSKENEIPHLALHHLRSGEVFETRRTKDDFDYLKDVLIKTKERVIAGDFTPFYGFHCNYCDFMDSVCKVHCVGLGSKLKKLEEKREIKPKINDLFSYTVPQPTINKRYLKNPHCSLETHDDALACLTWDEESPITPSKT